MAPRVRANRRWRFALEAVVAVICVALGPHVVSALASTGDDAPPDARPRAPEASLFARRLAALVASIPTAPPTRGSPDAGADDDLSPEAARLQNASIPISDAPNPAAEPFRLEAAGATDEARATDCMTAAVYYEAGQESVEGQRAVAQVVLNRLRAPQFPKTICDVVFQGSERPGCQFTFTCDGALSRPPSQDGWSRARKVAVAALHGYVMKAVGGATHYHADYVAPAWAPSLTKVAVVGQHIFYRWPGAGRWASGEAAGTLWEERTLQVATLDDAPPGLDRLPRTTAAPEPAPPPKLSLRPLEIASAKPAAPVVERAAERMVDPGAVAAKAGPILTPGELDWQGRPRQKGPPRLARPDSF